MTAVGDRVEFLGFGEPEPYSDLKKGALGTVVFIDDVGTVHVRWDDGRQLGLVTRPFGEAKARMHRTFMPDRFRVVSGE